MHKSLHVVYIQCLASDLCSRELVFVLEVVALVFGSNFNLQHLDFG
jgi:hypothetical protein